MAQDRLAAARILFDELVDLPPSKRASMLHDRCGNDTELGEIVGRLLKQHDNGLGGFLEQPFLGGDASETATDESLPLRIGAYEIVRKLGEGGMGIVYEARQENPRRTVALKVIRSGFVSAGLLKRFEHEAHMLGQLQHPGIAQIYEAGTADVVMRTPAIDVHPSTVRESNRQSTSVTRQSFFAMELVRGRILTQSANERQLGTRQRLDLFIHLCDAVQYAHGRGVIHRDIKPGNILVDELGQPKILDFGVARATNSDMQSLTLNTAVGQIVGTLPYMSPEQVSGDSAQIDFRADVYALGVTLYELLVGRLPFDLRNRSIPEAARIIREEEPTRLSSINPQLRGDIETIVAKAIEKERSHRYTSVEEMAADIRRYLNDEPVHARPASTWYQFQKFSRRNRGLVWGVAATLIVLLIGVIVSSSLAVYALRQRDVAEQRNVEATHQAYRAGLAAASSALQNGDIRLAQTHLLAAPKELRDWEWNHLNWLLNGDSITSTQPVGPNCRLAVSRDEQVLATLDSNGEAGIWSLPTLTLRLSFQISLRDAQSIVLDHDGRHMLVALPANGGVGVWDTSSGKSLWQWEHGDGVGAFSPVENVVAVLDRTADQIAVMDSTTGRLQRVVACGLGEHSGGWITVSRDGKYLEAASGALHRMLDFQSGRVIFERHSWFLAINEKWDKYTVFEPGPEKLEVVSTTDGSVLASIPWNQGAVFMQWLPDDAGLFVNSVNGRAAILDNTLHEVRTYVADRDYLRTRPLRDPRQCVRLLNDDRIQLQRTPTERTAFSLPHALRFVGASSDIATDGKTVVIGDWGYVRAYDTSTAALKWCSLLKRRFVTTVAISSDGKWIAAVDRLNDLWRLDSKDGAVLGQPVNLKDRAFSLAWIRDGQCLVAGLESGELLYVDWLKPPAEWRRVKAHDGPVKCIAISTDGMSFATCGDAKASGGVPDHAVDESDDNLLKIWDARTGECRARYSMNASVRVIGYSPDGKMLAAATQDKQVIVLDAANGSRMTILRGVGECRTLAFNTSGTRLVTFAEDGVARVWDVSRAEEVLNIQAARISAARFAPDGTSLIGSGPEVAIVSFDSGPEHAASNDRFIQLWAHRWLRDNRFDLIESLVQRLMQDSTLPAPVRDAAVALAQTTGDHVGWLISDAITAIGIRSTEPQALERAIHWTQRAIQLMPNDPNAATMYAEALYYHGQFPEALAQSKKSLDLLTSAGQTPTVDFLALLALCHHYTGNDVAAQEAMRRAESLATSEPHADSTNRTHFAEAVEVFRAQKK